MFQVDPAKTEIDNFLSLINQGIRYPLLASEFTRSVPIGIAPTIGNDYHNTQVILFSTDPHVYLENTVVEYRRIALPENRPTAGNKIFCTNDDTHLTIHQKILDIQRLVSSEIVFTDAVRRPEANETLTYTASAIGNSYIYTSSMNFSVINTDTLLAAQVDPSYFFGDPVGGTAEMPIFQTTQSIEPYMDSTKSGFDVMIDFLNGIGASPNGQLYNPLNNVYTSENSSWSPSNKGRITITPNESSFFKRAFQLDYTVHDLEYSNVFTGVPAEIMQIMDINTLKTAVREYLKFSADEFMITGFYTYGDYNSVNRKALSFTTRKSDLGNTSNPFTVKSTTGQIVLTS